MASPWAASSARSRSALKPAMYAAVDLENGTPLCGLPHQQSPLRFSSLTEGNYRKLIPNIGGTCEGYMMRSRLLTSAAHQ